jgi:hypothetical protein
MKPELKNIEDGLWGIISVYDPRKGRKVDLNELRYAERIDKMMDDIDSAEALTNDKALLMRLDILERSIRSLFKRIDAVRDRIDMRQMDKAATELFFLDPKRSFMLSESYIDEAEKILEQIRFANKVIEGHISEYDETELQILESENKKRGKAYKIWLLNNGIFGIIVIVLIIVLLVN